METQMNKEDMENFVIASNAIENIFGKRGLKWNNHIEAATRVLDYGDCGSFVHPLNIHKILMEGMLRSECVGIYRKSGVMIGGEICPSPASVPNLMINWTRKVNSFLSSEDSLTEKEKVDRCWNFHNYFECIHPFIDGNGRTGRLILNNLRQLCGLPWVIVDLDMQQKYYDKINEWKDKHFEEERKK